MSMEKAVENIIALLFFGWPKDEHQKKPEEKTRIGESLLFGAGWSFAEEVMLDP